MTARNLGERVFRTDRACPRCGYNVRGLSYGALCPECGTPAIAALTGAVPSELDSVLSAQIRRASVCALSSILTITVGLFLAFIASMMLRNPTPIFAAMLIAPALWPLSSWFATAALSSCDDKLFQLARLTARITTAVLPTVAVLAWLFWPPALSEWLIVLSGATMVVYAVMMAHFYEVLAERLGIIEVARTARRARRRLIATSLAGVAAFAAAALGFSSWIPGIVVVFALVIAALALGTIVFLPAILHVRLNKAQRRFNLIQSGEVDESSAEFDEFREFDPASAPADGSALRTPDSERT